MPRPGAVIEVDRNTPPVLFHFGEGARAGDELAALARWWSEGIGGVEDVTPPFVPSVLWSYLSEEIEPAWERPIRSTS